MVHDRERILNLNSAENKGGINEWKSKGRDGKKAEGDERLRERGKKMGGKKKRGSQRKASGREQETEKSKRAQNEKMIRFT